VAWLRWRCVAPLKPQAASRCRGLLAANASAKA